MITATSRVVEVAPGLAGIGYAAYSLSMFLGRVFGDRAAQRVAPVPMIRLLATLSGAGFLLALAVPALPYAVIGFALLGFGLSCIMPIVVRVAGQLPDQSTGPAVAAVTSVGWLGVVSGPPLIGAIAATTTLSVALAVLVLLTAFIFLLAPVARQARTGPTG